MIKVLVVDDSFLMRKLISDMLESDPDIKIIGKAINGEDALKKIEELKPDVITLDIEMPKLSGLDVLYEVMRTNPTPIIVVSAYTRTGSIETINALEYGAIDFVTKPSGPISMDIKKIREDLIEKVKIAATIKVKRPIILDKRETLKAPKYSKKVLVIGASSGGPPALRTLLSSLPEDFPIPILIVQHMPVGFTKTFADSLDKLCSIKVKEAEEGDKLEPGVALLAPGGRHMVLKEKGKDELAISLNKDSFVNNIRPSVDVTMQSAAHLCRENTIGVILTGMGRDGTRGMAQIKREKGKTIAQNKDTCLIYGMPKEAIESGCTDYVLPLQEISKKIIGLL